MKKYNIYLKIVVKDENNKKVQNDDLNRLINVSLPIILSKEEKFFNDKEPK